MNPYADASASSTFTRQWVHNFPTGGLGGGAHAFSAHLREPCNAGPGPCGRNTNQVVDIQVLTATVSFS